MQQAPSHRDHDTLATAAIWIRRCGLPLAILAWTGVALVSVWLLGQIIQTLLLLTFAALLAYALAPAVAVLIHLPQNVVVIAVVATAAAHPTRRLPWHTGL